MTGSQYSEYMLASMQATYGQGFLSPGAAPETRQMVGDFDIRDKACLDLGCGVGGACILLATEFSPTSVVGIDVEPAQLDQARAMAGDLENLSFELAEPGCPLPLESASFDFAMSKDVVCHVADKIALFREVLRALKPGGLFVVGDWHRTEDNEAANTFDQWNSQLARGGLMFDFETMESYRSALDAAGFETVSAFDHTPWSTQSAREQLEYSTGEGREEILATFGEHGYARRVSITRTRLLGLEDGCIQHWHLRASKSRT